MKTGSVYSTLEFDNGMYARKSKERERESQIFFKNDDEITKLKARKIKRV